MALIRPINNNNNAITINIGEYAANATAQVDIPTNHFSSFKVTQVVGTTSRLQYATALDSTDWIDITLNQDYDVSNLTEFKVRVSKAGDSTVATTYATFAFT